MNSQSNIEKVVEKIENSHQAIANSISGFGSELKNTNVKINNIEEVLDEHGKVIEKMLIQTTKTNGNVTQLQLWQAGIRGTVYGVGACMSIIVALASVVFWIQVGSLNTAIGNVKELVGVNSVRISEIQK